MHTLALVRAAAEMAVILTALRAQQIAAEAVGVVVAALPLGTAALA